MRVSQRDRLGSVSHASRRCASGSNGTIDIPVVVQWKGVGVDGTEGGAFWGILTELPGSQTGLARGAWGGMSSPNRTLLATGKMGRGREWGSRASHTVVPWTWEPGGKRNCSFLRKWVPLALGPAAEQKRKILLPALHQGKERRCSRRLLRKSKFQHLRVARVRAASSTSWTTWGLAGTRGAPLTCERLDAPAKVSIRPGAEQLWRKQEGAHGDGQTEAWPRGQRWMVHHAGAGVLDRLGLLLYRRELLGKALDGVAEPCLGDGGVEKACLVNVLHLYQVEPEMALLDHHGGHRLPEGPRRDFRRS